MAENNESRPVILVDLKKYRIRIHKITLLYIGNPKYVLLLINPDKRILAILPCDRSDPRAHHISSASYKQAFELYSRSLVKNLRNVCSNWQDRKSYRLYGEVIPSKGIAQFQMSEAILVNGVDA